MSRELISRSPDLKRLQDDGYDIEVRGAYLLVNHVPYVNGNRQVNFGVLVSALELSGDVTIKPTDHVAMFAGETPCDQEGEPLVRILNASDRRDLGDGITIDHTFSSKPTGGYADYYDKMTTYINILAGQAQAIDSSAKAITFPVI